MGLELLITEFDVHDLYLPADTAARDAQVAAMAKGWLDVTLSYPRLRSMLTWGLADSVSWLQDFMPRADGLPKRPTPYDANLQPKCSPGRAFPRQVRRMGEGDGSGVVGEAIRAGDRRRRRSVAVGL